MGKPRSANEEKIDRPHPFSAAGNMWRIKLRGRPVNVLAEHSGTTTWEPFQSLPYDLFPKTKALGWCNADARVRVITGGKRLLLRYLFLCLLSTPHIPKSVPCTLGEFVITRPLPKLRFPKGTATPTCWKRRTRE